MILEELLVTSGTKTVGTSVQYPGSSHYLRKQHGTKTWSGTDNVVKRKTKPIPVEGPNGDFVWMWNGRRQRRIWLPKPAFYSYKRRDPKRKFQEEHPYNMTVQVTDDDRFYFKGHPVQPWTLATGMTLGLGGTAIKVSSGWSSEHDYLLLSRLRTQVAGSNFDFGVFLGEGKEALTMIANAANRIFQASFAIKRGDLGWAARALVNGTDRQKLLTKKASARNWLELQYGWLPLLNDAKEGAEFLAHKLNVPLQQTIRVSAKAPGRLYSDSAGWEYQGIYETRKRLKAVLKESSVQQMKGLIDPLTVAWELTPWSFVVDWFIPIGEYLQARGLASRLTGTYVTSTRTVKDLQKVVPKGTTSVMSPCPFREKTVVLSRTVSTNLSVPLPKAVGLMEAYSWRRAANAVALLVTRAPRILS